MPRPTKFDLMRENRLAADVLRMELLRRSFKAQIAEIRRQHEEAMRSIEAAPVPSMEIDGVKYVETARRSYCQGCAFERDAKSCLGAFFPSRKAFGATCGLRSVIYVRAEA